MNESQVGTFVYMIDILDDLFNIDSLKVDWFKYKYNMLK